MTLPKILWLFRSPNIQTSHLFLIKELLIFSGQFLPALWHSCLDRVLMKLRSGIRFTSHTGRLASLFSMSPGCTMKGHWSSRRGHHAPFFRAGGHKRGQLRMWGRIHRSPHWLQILNPSILAQGSGSKATRKGRIVILGRSRTWR